MQIWYFLNLFQKKKTFRPVKKTKGTVLNAFLLLLLNLLTNIYSLAPKIARIKRKTKIMTFSISPIKL